MKCYIYKIINQITGEKYVGQTTNFSRRIEVHKSKLKNNKHPNPKLQASWNKYGEENFIITKEKFDLSKEELNEKEIEEIEKEDSFNNGFNLTLGGDGGNTRGSLSFEDYCFAYLGNKKYQGMTQRTGKYLGVDSSTISAITREKAYLWYKERINLLSDEEKEGYLRTFEKEMDLKNNPPRLTSTPLNDEQVVDFLCIVSVYGRGAEAAVTRFFQRAKGLKHHIIKGEYKEGVKQFQKLTDEEILNRGKRVFETNDLQQYCKQTIRINSSVIRPI